MRLDTGQRVQSQRCKETRRRCVQAAVGRAARRVSPSTMGGCNRLGRAARTPFRPVAVFPFFKSAVSKPPSAEEPVSQQKQQQQHPHHHGHQHHHHHHKFDLPLAVVLAGAAFESYLQPQGGQGFQQRTVGGPTVTYTDKSFLTQTHYGVLHVQLLSASNLRPADPGGASDPYALLQLGACSVRSATVWGSLEPRWGEGEAHCLYVRDPRTEVLRVRLYDEDPGPKSDDELGIAMMGLGVLLEGQGEEQEAGGEGAGGKARTVTLPLRGSGAGSGASVTLRVRLLAFSDADPADVAALTSRTTTAPSPSALAGLQAAAAAVSALPQQLEAVMGAARGQQGQKERGEEGQENEEREKEEREQQQQLAQEQPQVQLPGGEQVPNPWRVLAAMAGRAAGGEGAALTPVAFVENEETDTQVWLYRNLELREAVIAFRGTEQVKWKDLATDLNLTPCSLNPERLDDNAGLPFTARIIRAVTGVQQQQMMVHKGFLDAYDSVRATVFALLDAATATTGSSSASSAGSSSASSAAAHPDGGAPVWRVLVTGHSLGGALATLAAYELAERRTPARSRQSISLYTFGAPRVGNRAFAAEFDGLVPDAWRVTNSNDIIPSVPRLMGYCHVGRAVRLGADGRLRVGRRNSSGSSSGSNNG
ncbi:hypothetical protein Agub_g6182, partial [Astrephomene gubernaculifera]